MIQAFALKDGRLDPVDLGQPTRGAALWIDLVSPTREEETLVEGWLGLDIPTRDEMAEIELSSRLYSEADAHFMTANLTVNTERERPQSGPVTFVLTGGRLITIRYIEPSTFATFVSRGQQGKVGCTDAASLLLALLEAVIARSADTLERIGADIGDLSERIFYPAADKASKRDRDFQVILRRLGRKEELVASVQESLYTLQRLVGYLAYVSDGEKNGRHRTRSLTRDIGSLADHGERLSNKVIFLLDATLGMISIEQNSIIKIVSVAATVFLPPTLVASVYGMNFQFMPELGSPFGYPLALLAMAVSAALPLWYVKKRGWL